MPEAVVVGNQAAGQTITQACPTSGCSPYPAGASQDLDCDVLANELASAGTGNDLH